MNAMSSSLRAALIGALLVCGAGWALFHFEGVTDVGYLADQTTTSLFRWIANRWYVDWLTTHYAMNFLAPPTALWLLWRRRDALCGGPHSVAWMGLALVVLALALHVLGAKTQQTRISLFALILLVWAVPWFAWGPRVARGMAYPMLALAMAMPLNFFDQFLNPLRVTAAAVSAALASGLGLSVQAMGSLLVEAETRAWALDLADPTSSVFALHALTMWTLILADLVFRRTAQRLALVALTPLLFLAATTMRGLTLCFAAEGWSPDLALSLDDRWPALVLLPWFLLFQGLAIRLLTVQWREARRSFATLMAPHNRPSAPADREGLP